MIEQATAIRCPSCGAPVKSYGAECEYCGTRVVRKEDAYKPVYIPVEVPAKPKETSVNMHDYVSNVYSNYVDSNYYSSIIVSNFSNCVY
jgi:DNA-directed RNA polymerase subunit RPC12/RpoP